ncbi:MAG: PAS domain-containing sensor histidine kinase [Anaerolineales bacterium]|nr:PAS domain-containing sensor histidine kinase [Anaerolineales bacterium]
MCKANWDKVPLSLCGCRFPLKLVNPLAYPAQLAHEHEPLLYHRVPGVKMEKPLLKPLPLTQTRQIERAKREWEVTVDTLPQLICLLDYQGRVIRVNRTAERWNLAPVVTVKGREAHHFLHEACTDPACYLLDFLQKAWPELEQGQSVEYEIQDKILGRYLHLQIRPLAIHPQRSDEDLAADSFAVLVLEDISKQKQTEAALHQYTCELKERNEDLDAFSHTVAHNLKGLLLPVIGYAELLNSPLYLKASRDSLPTDLKRIAKTGYKMRQVIDELLLLAEIRKSDLQLKPLDMPAIIAEVQHRLAYVIEEAQAELILPPDSTWPTARGYAPWVEEVWTNYLSNALKYGGQPPRIELGATISSGPDNLVCFWIRDNGPGLSQEQQDQLFKPFARLDQVKVDGSGLGLSIVRRIVEKMGGQVAVESEGVPGRGSTFGFILPAA